MIRPVRWLRVLGFARGPLSRRSDRAQKMLFVGVIAAACLAIPIAGTIADTVAADRQPVDGYQTYAVLAQDAPLSSSSSEYGAIERPSVKANWRAPDGSPRSGPIEADPGAKAGQKVLLWTDTSGAPLAEVLAPAELQMQVFLMAGMAGLGWLAGIAVVYVLLAWVLWRRRIAAWEADWERADQDWRRKTS